MSYEKMFVEYATQNFKDEDTKEDSKNKYLKTSNLIIKAFDLQKILKDEYKPVLLIGKIQSGKTNVFITHIFNSFANNNVDLAIVFSGTKNNLNKQTFSRITSFLESKGIKDIICTEDPKGAPRIDRPGPYKSKMIIVVKKHVQDLQKLIESVINIKEKNVIIIDDEADNASQDNNYKSKDATAINSKIIQLIKKLRSGNNITRFLSVTATPQINLILEREEKLRPDKIVFSPEGKGYCGLEYFHNATIPVADNKYIYTIPEHEINNLKMDGGRWRNNDIFNTALLHYFITKVTYDCKYSHEWTKMMIHIQKEKITHAALKHLIIDTLFMYFIPIKELEKVYEKNMSNLDKEIRFIKKDLRYDTDEKVIRVIREHAEFFYKNKDSQIVIINSDKDNEKESRNFSGSANLDQIIIGGESLSRGLTIKNLTTVIYLRGPITPTIDATLQRARWFGYRKKLSNYFKLFTSQKICNDFMTIANHEKHLWKQGEEESILDRAKLLINTRLNLTRRSVKDLLVTKGAKDIHTPVPIRNDISADLASALNGIINNEMPIETKNSYDNQYKYTKRYKYSFVRIQKLVELFKDFHQKDIFGPELLSIYYILESCQDQDKLVRLISMRPKVREYRDRSYDGLKVKALLQGKSDKNETYCGDAQLVEETIPDDTIEFDLQVHEILDKNKSNSDINLHLALFSSKSHMSDEREVIQWK